MSHSRRPLQAHELCHAIAIRIGSTNHNSDDILTLSTLINCCQGLVTLEKTGSAVRLIHFTLQEYLRAHPDLFNRPHSTMAETCLTYLNFQHIKDLSPELPPDPRDTPFLEYSSLYWGTHMRMEISDCSKFLALQLLDRFDGHISAKSLWNSVKRELSVNLHNGDELFSALHCISYFGVAEVANTLIDMGRWDVNQEDSAGRTPLIWAARHGHEEVVSLLLRNKNIQPDRHDSNCQTALSCAAQNGHEGVVELLLGHGDVNPDSSCYSSSTPLSSASEGGHEGIVKLLLGRKEVNPNSSNSIGRTPLFSATEGGHEGIVKLLLCHQDINPELPSSYALTPLSRAAWNGHEGIVKLLLERKDVNPDSLSKSGRTPLSWAAEEGHEGIVKLLLGRKDVNPDTPDTDQGRTPLSWAVGCGRGRVAKLLLKRNDVNPNSSSKSGETPLMIAAKNKHHSVVELLQTQNCRPLQ